MLFEGRFENFSSVIYMKFYGTCNKHLAIRIGYGAILEHPGLYFHYIEAQKLGSRTIPTWIIPTRITPTWITPNKKKRKREYST